LRGGGVLVAPENLIRVAKTGGAVVDAADEGIDAPVGVLDQAGLAMNEDVVCIARKISRSELTEWTRELIERGLGAIDALLERNHLSYHQIALCLPTGGMVNMPAVRDGLNERFEGRARRLPNGDRIISEGAAWIAHDEFRLGLAKPIELLQSDDTYAAVVPIPFELPIENETRRAAAEDYHCVDPRPGRASFMFARPSRPRPRDARSDRKAYATLHLAVDESAPPLMERLKLGVVIDHDYVAHVDLRSTMRKDHVKTEIFDLEFTLRFPKAVDKPPKVADEKDKGASPSEELVSVAPRAQAGKVQLRSNVSVQASWQNVPGDLVEKYRPAWFDARSREYSEWQYEERVYYKDCPYCHRSRYEYRTDGCDDPRCLWRQACPTHPVARSDVPSPENFTRPTE